MFIPFIILTSWWTKAEFICIHFHRTLSEGQEIDIRSIFFRKGPFWDFWLNLFFLFSYHSTWRCWDVFYPFDVYRLMSHVIRLKTFFQSLTVIIRNRKIGTKRTKWYLKLKHLLHLLQINCFCDQRIIEPEVLIQFLMNWPNWSISRS